jgi:multidrug resistance efflux pump
MAATDEQAIPVSDTGGKTVTDAGEVKPDTIAKRIRNHPWFWRGVIVLVILASIGGILYWNDMESRIYLENAQVTAPVIAINPVTPGVIDEIYVSVGDTVRKDQILAKVGDEVLHAKTHGVITGVENTPGHIANPMTDPRPVIAMIDTRELRVTGRVQEDKGLKDIHPGQYVTFTVDAFPSSQY